MRARGPVDPEQLADWVLARPVHPAAGVRAVALDGRSGAGKTTLATALVTVLRERTGDPVTLVSMDQLYPGWDGLAAAVPRLVAVLRPLVAGLPAALPRWDWQRDCEAGHAPVPAARHVVVEGVGCGARAAAPLLSGLLWLTAPDGERYRRAMARDGDGFRPHWERWAAQEEAYLARERPDLRADLVADTGPP